MLLKLLKYSYSNNQCKKIDLSYSEDMREEMELYNQMLLDIVCLETVENFIEMNPDYNKLIEAHAKKNNLEGIAILMAHGQKIKNNWYYFNEDAGSPVQSWINQNDGKYKALILYSCNPGRDEIKSEKSPVLTPNEVFSNRLFEKGKVQIELFMPGSD